MEAKEIEAEFFDCFNSSGIMLTLKLDSTLVTVEKRNKISVGFSAALITKTNKLTIVLFSDQGMYNDIIMLTSYMYVCRFSSLCYM